MEMAAEQPLPLSSELLATSSVWTWIDSMPEGLVAFLLITPPMGGAVDMQAFATRACLGAPNQPMPDSTIQLVIQGADAVLAICGTETALRVSITPEWAQFVRAGGTVVVVIGADPLLPTAARREVDDYLLGAVLPRKLWMGKTRLAAEFTEDQVHGRACRCCGSAEAPLHPDKALVTRVTTGVVRDTVTAVCTDCLVLR
ncbi:hypothetical protein [Kitasatospora sp. MAP5-34]|uniref:hypothetical protein n=1 Tax=Kitasatospora sp. MAP5-34 TaxID=3035102 RepID=UPI00247700A2|nr:hypothetical protein [Kitasatospora sp. MAP5-34]MDH6578603.1 hypothetical protein [Kitasatospora sp. MAP5-34]